VKIPVAFSAAELVRAFDQLGVIALGRLVGPVAVATTSTKIAHGLGRVPQGWIEVSPQNGAAVVKEASAPDATYLYAIAGTAVTAARMWVF
jgi:hypothetical protein